MKGQKPAGPAGGPKKVSGKKGKKFAEDLGIDHLKSLSDAITGSRDEQERERLEKAKKRQEATKAKKQKKLAGSPDQDGPGAKRANGLEHMKAVLKAKLKEKAKKRKEARKQSDFSASAKTTAAPGSKATAASTRPKSANAPKPAKRVGFA